MIKLIDTTLTEEARLLNCDPTYTYSCEFKIAGSIENLFKEIRGCFKTDEEAEEEACELLAEMIKREIKKYFEEINEENKK